MAAVTPAPGKMAVEYRTSLGPMTKPLDQVREGKFIDVKATIVRVVRSGPSKAMRATIVIADENGDSAHGSVTADTLRRFATAIREGAQVLVTGTVVYMPDDRPIIDVRAVRELGR